ncbi:MAG: glycosyltransferase [Candidatus Uhrbacteria bacterium]|nr:glycosyltransferase [Candidatus Uhrbacteria bacterium]
MRTLSVSLDRRVLDPNSAVGQRQAAYYRDHEVSYIVLDAPGSKLGTLFAAWRQARHMRGIDLVTTQDPFFCGWIGRVAAKAAKAALHVQDHSGAFGRPAFGWRERMLRPVATYVLRNADRVRTVSERGKRGLVSIGIPASKIDVIPIATDVSRFAFVDRSRVMPNQILCVSRLEKEKGIGVLLSAFHLLHTKHPETSLVIVGDGSERATLEKLARSLRIDDAVLFAGAQHDVTTYLARASAYVQSSYFEGWGLAVIEAAVAGLPIVMTDVGCAGEVIKDGESGLVVPPGNVKALAEALERVLNDAALRRTLGEAARRAVASLPGPDATVEAIRRSLEASLKNSP